MQAPARIAVILLAPLLVGACHSPSESVPDRLPVISLTLVAGESLQVASVYEGARADSTIPAQPVPIDSTRVRLVVDGPGGTTPLLPRGNGEFAAALSVQPGGQYTLRGTVDGDSVKGRTTVPLRFDFLAPSGDTIVVAPGGCSSYPGPCATYAFDMDPPGGTPQCRLAATQPPGSFCQLSGATTGSLVVFGAGGILPAVFLGYGQDAADWLFRPTPRGNLTGAFGGFGGAIAVRRFLDLR